MSNLESRKFIDTIDNYSYIHLCLLNNCCIVIVIKAEVET